MRRLTLFLTLLFTQLAFADYKVTKISPSGGRAVLSGEGKSLAGDYVSFEDEFKEACVAKVVGTQDKDLIVDISTCKNSASVKVGSVFKPANHAAVYSGTAPTVSPAAPPEEEPLPDGLRTRNEDWYFAIGLGVSSVDYSGGEAKDRAKEFEDLNADHSAVNMNLGFYWPLINHKAMHGFNLNFISDTYVDEDITYVDDYTLTILSSLYAYSYHHFFGPNIGDGFFVRGDIGFHRLSVSMETDTTDIDNHSDSGLGILVGGGYAWASSRETRVIFDLNYSSRKADKETMNASSLTASLLF